MILNEQEQAIENRMNAAFHKQAAFVPDRLQPAEPSPVVTLAGGEIELFLFNQQGKLATDEQKNRVLEKTNAGVELGACAVEIHPDPVNLPKVGFEGWLAQLQEEENLVVESAKSHGLFVGRSGTIPWVDPRDIKRTNEEKYQLVPDFHDRHRSPHSNMKVGNTRLNSAAEVGGINSFQFSIQAKNAPDSVDILNRMFMISPLVCALSTNSRIINCNDSCWADTRFEIWRQTHDTRSLQDIAMGKVTRVGLPAQYPKNLDDYLNEISSHPFILDKEKHALAVGIGLSWRDARIKILGESDQTNKVFVVEFRPISTQPTLKEDLALAAFTIGRLHWSQIQQEVIPPIDLLMQNKKNTEKFGINARIRDQEGVKNIRKILSTEITRAEIGLKEAGIFDNTAKNGLNILRERVETGITPDKKLLRLSPTQLMDAVKII